MEISGAGEIKFDIEFERGEWTLRNESWSVAHVSFTVRKSPRGDWSVRIDHTNFKAYERTWGNKNKVTFSAGRRFPGFYPRVVDIPSSVTAQLFGEYSNTVIRFPALLPPLDMSGPWGQG